MVQTPVTGSLSCDATESFAARAELTAYIVAADGVEWKEKWEEGGGAETVGSCDVTHGERHRWTEGTRGWERVGAPFRDVID